MKKCKIEKNENVRQFEETWKKTIKTKQQINEQINQGPPRGEKKGKIEKIEFPLKKHPKNRTSISKIVDTSGPIF